MVEKSLSFDVGARACWLRAEALERTRAGRDPARLEHDPRAALLAGLGLGATALAGPSCAAAGTQLGTSSSSSSSSSVELVLFGIVELVVVESSSSSLRNRRSNHIQQRRRRQRRSGRRRRHEHDDDHDHDHERRQRRRGRRHDHRHRGRERERRRGRRCAGGDGAALRRRRPEDGGRRASIPAAAGRRRCSTKRAATARRSRSPARAARSPSFALPRTAASFASRPGRRELLGLRHDRRRGHDQVHPLIARSGGRADLVFHGDNFKDYFGEHQAAWAPIAEPVGGVAAQASAPPRPRSPCSGATRWSAMPDRTAISSIRPAAAERGRRRTPTASATS